MNTQSEVKSIKILICAMGGEGGGVLMNWIVKAAWAKGYPVQATSVPGVAQRTGATTYYIEMLPQNLTSNSPKPIFALIPTAGEVDLLIATETAEAARAASNGFITPDRTHLIASTARAYLMPEKMAMADGRIDDEQLRIILEKSARNCVLFDANKAAKESGAIVNAVMLGAIAATDLIGIGLEDFIQAIRAEGKAVETNIAGLNKGYALAEGECETTEDIFNTSSRPQIFSNNEFPESVQPILWHAINRLTDYQNKAYADFYLSRLEQFKKSNIDLLRVVAKQLALRMTYEDIIRVAQAKVRAERFERIKGEANTMSDDILMVTDFFKPGIAEISDMLPPILGKKLLAWGKKHGKLENFGFDMEVKTTSVTGFLKLWLLATLKWWRPRSYRWRTEQASINDWLNMIMSASLQDNKFAIEIAELSRLLKGYGSTHRRGMKNFTSVVGQFIKPTLKESKASVDAAKKLRCMHDAANKDPDGFELEKILAK